MRLFIAFEVENLSDYFLALQKRFLSSADLTLTKEFHLTFKFLGEVNERRILDTVQRLKTIKFESFNAKTTKVQGFPNDRTPRVIWIGLEPKDKIIELQQKIDESLKGIFDKEERFEPHITLARVKYISNKKNLDEQIKIIKPAQKEIKIDNFKIIKSTLTPKGPEYEDVEIFLATK
ncbi:MAG: RNA 2',3'-cyclic phosphodiesterase [Nanoarchaeota archaeon]